MTDKNNNAVADELDQNDAPQALDDSSAEGLNDSNAEAVDGVGVALAQIEVAQIEVAADSDAPTAAATAEDIEDGEIIEPPAPMVDFSQPKRVGLILFFLVFGVFGIWSAVAQLESAALATGVVAVKSHKKTVQHLEGGIVKDINVRNGDLVETGDVLVVIDETQARAQLEIIRGQFAAYKALESRLFAERDGSAQVAYSDDLPADDTRADAEMLSQNQLFAARKSSNLGEVSVLEQRIEQLYTKVQGLKALKKSKESLASSYLEEISDYRELLEEGFADKMRLRELERSHASLEGEVAELVTTIAGTEVQVGETRLNILQLGKDFYAAVVDELSQVQTSLNDTEERMSALLDTVARTEIRAPAAGIVHGLQVHTIGAVLSPGSPILDVVPQSETLIVEAQVSPMDIDRVFIGQDAKIRFSAFKSATTQVISAELISLSADRLIDEQSGMPYYMARVEVTDVGIKEMRDLVLLPGMPAEVLINTGSRTLFQYLGQPISDALARSMIED